MDCNGILLKSTTFGVKRPSDGDFLHPICTVVSSADESGDNERTIKVLARSKSHRENDSDEYKEEAAKGRTKPNEAQGLIHILLPDLQSLKSKPRLANGIEAHKVFDTK